MSGDFDNIVAYKYMPKKFVEDFACGRSIKLGTYHEYRNCPNEKRGDKFEGRAYAHLDSFGMRQFDQYNSEHVNVRANALRGRVNLNLQSMSNISIEHCTFDLTEMDAFILCFSEHYAPESMTDFGGCVQISSIGRFFSVLTERLGHWLDISDARIDRVQYIGNFHDARRSIPHNPFLKPVDGYAEQQEIRMYWQVPFQYFSYPYPAILAACLEVSEYCSLMPEWEGVSV